MNNNKPLHISSPKLKQDPHGHYAWMRENAPVYRAKLGWRKDVYLITRYEDVSALLLDQDRLIKNQKNAKTDSGKSSGIWIPKTFRPLMHNMLFTDEPDHRRLRNLVHKAFTPRMIMNLQPRIESIANDLLHGLAQKSNIDLIQDFALPLPVTVIAEMVGIPTADQDKFRQWTERIVVNPTPANMIGAISSVRAFMRYTRTLAAKRRANPKDDLISALVLAEDNNESFSEDEVIGMVFLLLVAGHETTVGLIGNGARALLSNPEQLDLLRNQPELLDSAIEEMLRFDGPLQTTEQSFAKKSFELHGVTIPQGAVVSPSILSANRDETVFEHPNQFNIERTPNKHLAFGKGIHYCLGAPLARLEAKVAFSTLLQQAPNLRLTVPDSTLRYSELMMVNRVEKLPVAL